MTPRWPKTPKPQNPKTPWILSYNLGKNEICELGVMQLADAINNSFRVKVKKLYHQNKSIEHRESIFTRAGKGKNVSFFSSVRFINWSSTAIRKCNINRVKDCYWSFLFRNNKSLSDCCIKIIYLWIIFFSHMEDWRKIPVLLDSISPFATWCKDLSVRQSGLHETDMGATCIVLIPFIIWEFHATLIFS